MHSGPKGTEAVPSMPRGEGDVEETPTSTRSREQL